MELCDKTAAFREGSTLQGWVHGPRGAGTPSSAFGETGTKAQEAMGTDSLEATAAAFSVGL